MNMPTAYYVGPSPGPVPKIDTNVELESILSARVGSPVQPGSYSLQLKITRKTQFTSFFPSWSLPLCFPRFGDLILRCCSVFRSILRHFPSASPPTASRESGAICVCCLYTRRLACKRSNPPSYVRRSCRTSRDNLTICLF